MLRTLTLLQTCLYESIRNGDFILVAVGLATSLSIVITRHRAETGTKDRLALTFYILKYVLRIERDL